MNQPRTHAGIACDDLFIVHDHVARGVRTAARHQHRHRLSDDPIDPADADADAAAEEEAGFAEDDASLDAAVTAASAANDDADLDARLMEAWRHSLGAVAMTTATNVGAFLTTLQSSVPNLFTFGILMARAAPSKR